jgi:hypothetical protein
MVATHRRRAGWAGAAGATGALLLGAPASPGTAQALPAEAPHGQLLQAPDGTLYLLVAGRAHPITPAPLTEEALAAAPAGEALPDGTFWLVPAAAPPALAPAAPAAPSTPTPVPTLAPFFASQTRAPGTSAFFATQTAVAPRAVAAATATVSAAPRPGRKPAGQS